MVQHISIDKLKIEYRNGNIAIYRGTMEEEDIRKAITETEMENVKLKGIVSIDEKELVQLEEQAKDFILYMPNHGKRMP